MAEFMFNCPQCGQRVEADESFCGKVAECPHCGKGIVVPCMKTTTFTPVAPKAAPDEQAIQIRCPHCGQPIKADESYCGFGECPYCGKAMVVTGGNVTKASNHAPVLERRYVPVVTGGKGIGVPSNKSEPGYNPLLGVSALGAVRVAPVCATQKPKQEQKKVLVSQLNSTIACIKSESFTRGAQKTATGPMNSKLIADKDIKDATIVVVNAIYRKIHNIIWNKLGVLCTCGIMIIMLFVIAVIMLHAMVPSDASRLNCAILNYENKNYGQAVRDLINLAKKGSARAKVYLGDCYANGNGVEKDPKIAVEWYRAAAHQGEPEAKHRMFVCCRDGIGIEANEEEITKWSNQAAWEGFAEAQYFRGACNALGAGRIKQDYIEAVNWYRQAAEKGNPDAQVHLGICYANGKGVAKDDVEAAKWYRKAAEQGNSDAQSRLGACYDKGKGVTANRAEAVKWHRKAARQGCVNSQYALGLAYESGSGVTQNYMLAQLWLKKALDGGDKKAQVALNEIATKVKEKVAKEEAELAAYRESWRRAEERRKKEEEDELRYSQEVRAIKFLQKHNPQLLWELNQLRRQQY